MNNPSIEKLYKLDDYTRENWKLVKDAWKQNYMTSIVHDLL